MRAIAPLTDVLARVYAPEPDRDRWLEGIRDAASSAFGGQSGVQVFLLRLTASTACVDAVSADNEEVRRAVIEAHRHADEPMVRAFRSRTVGRALRDIGSSHPTRDVANQAGVSDVISSLGFADHSHACSVAFSIREHERVTRGALTSLQRLSAHLAASYRLRLHAEQSDDASADAVLSPEGAVLDATGHATERSSRERLRDAATAIARAKREAPSDPAECLAFWRAMVEGRWTLVERIDSDGKRLLLAKRNAPSSPLSRALTERERTVVERAALGGSLRHLAYELGLAESTVSETLARGLKKLGLKSRAELVELRASLDETA